MMLNTVERRIGAIQLGLRTISSNVFFGEKSTPKILATALSEGCASGVGVATGVVAIEDSSTTRLRTASFYTALRVGIPEYFSGGILAQRGKSCQLSVGSHSRSLNDVNF